MTDTITIDDFAKLDIRIGTILKAEVPEWSHWVIKLDIDLGKEIGERVIFAGIMKFYKPERLVGKQVPIIVNLEPKKIGPEGDYSQGMMLMAVEKDDLSPKAGETKPAIFLGPKKKVPNGTKVC